jgi:porphobilinogen synthase
VQNDPTLELLGLTAISQAEAGADIIAPSGMIDGMVGTIRQSLDENAFENKIIMSYAAKYCSAFYGPFREAAGSDNNFKGDRKSHQMDPPNSSEAVREAAEDIDEGADMVIVKPALPYLDIVYRVKNELGVPTVAYNVSGEYSMIKQAAESGLLEGKAAVFETLTCIKRAGADMIITYFAKEAVTYKS